MKLGKQQSDVINYLRRPGAAFLLDTWKGRWRGDAKSYRFEFGERLKKLGLIYKDTQIGGTDFYELTELGKTIDL